MELKKFGFAYIIGDKGSGKTTLATAMAKIDHDAGAPVYLNYPVSFTAKSNYTAANGLPESMTAEEIVEDFNTDPQKFHGATIVFDEAHRGFSARKFFQQSNNSLVDFVSMLRKLKATLVLVSQKFRKVDKWVREDAEYIIAMEAEHPELEHNEHFYMRVYDQNSGSVHGFLHPDRISWEGWFHGKQYFKLYDTDLIIGFNKNYQKKQ